MGEKSEVELSGEEAQYEALAEELGDDLGGSEPPAPSEEGGEPASKEKAADEAEPSGRQPTFEELQTQLRRVNGALKESREREDAHREQLRGVTELINSLRAERRAKQQPAKEEEAPKAPDPYEDPIGYVEHMRAEINREIADLKQHRDQTQQQTQQQVEYRQFMDVVSRAEDAFAAQTPDYHDAAKHLEDSRRAELEVLFPDTPQMRNYARQHGLPDVVALRNAVFVNDAQTVARNALMAGINPAEAYYSLAKQRGYKPDATKLVTSPAAKQAADVIDMTRRGKRASRTISGGEGGPDNPLSVSDLADLYADDPDEFDKQWDKMAKAGRLG